ncbi:MAG: hypothetical protein ACRDY5_05805, partial [Acidimicrobiales bacterium]
MPGPDALPDPARDDPVDDDGDPGENSAAAEAEARFDRSLPLPFWARFPTGSTRSEHFLFLHPPGLAGVDRVAALAEQAREQLVPRLRFGRADQIHLVVLARDRAAYAEVLEDDGAAASLALVNVLYI